MADPLADLNDIRSQSQGVRDPLADLAAIRGTSAPAQTAPVRHAATPPPPPLSAIDQAGNQFGAASQGFLDTTFRPLAELHQAGMEANNAAPGSYGWGVLKALGRGVVSSMRGEEDAAAEDFANHHYISGVGHHIAASIPIIGPLTAEIGSGLGTGVGEMVGGDPNSTTFARTSGKIGGLLAADMLRGGVSKLREITPPAPGEPGGALSNALEGSRGPGRLPFKEYRAKQLAAESASYEKAAADLAKQHEADAAAAAQKSRAQYGANLQNFKGANNRLIQAAHDEVAKVAPLNTPEDIGTATGDSIAAVKGTAQDLYNQVTEATAPTKVSKIVVTQRPTGILDPQGNPATLPQTSQQIVNEGGVRVSLTGQKAIAQRYIDSLNERPYATPGAADIKAQLQRIVDGPDTTSFAGASGSASDLLDAARKLDEPLPKLRGKINAEIAGELKRSTNAAVADQAPEVAASLDHANQLWVDLHRPGVVELLDRAQNAPETVHQWLSDPKTTLRDMRDARKVLSPAVWRSMNARALADELESSIKSKTIDPTDKTLPALQFIKVGDSLTNTLNEWDRSGKLAEMFPETANTLRQIVKTASELRKPSPVKPAATPLDVKAALGEPPQPYKPEPNLGSWLTDIAMGGYGLHSLFTKNPTEMAGTAAAGAVTYGVAKLLTNPTGANLVLRYVKAQSAGNAGLAASLGTKLAALATREQRMNGGQQTGQSSMPVGTGTRTAAMFGVKPQTGALVAGPPVPPSPLMETPNWPPPPPYGPPAPAENGDYLDNKNPATVLPSRFKTALAATVASPRKIGATDSAPGPTEKYDWQGRYLDRPDTIHGLGANTALVSKGVAGHWSETLYHELGHAIYEHDLTKQETAQVKKYFNDFLHERVSWGPQTEAAFNGPGQRKVEEFFPSMVSLYVTRPSVFKKEAPEGYALMKKIFGGREYIGAGGAGARQ